MEDNLMKASFDPEYAYHLGYHDGLEDGHKDPKRDFDRSKTDPRTIAYFAGLKAGMAQAQKVGLDMRCLVRWDKPGFDTPQCESKSHYLAFAYGHVIPLCIRHAFKIFLDIEGKPDANQWTIIPKDWV